MSVNSPQAGASPTHALYTDHYELTMLQAALHSGAAHRRRVFEVFARRLPDGRRYGIVAGTGRLLEAWQQFRFGAERAGFPGAAPAWWTTTPWPGWRISVSPGNIYGYAEGEAYFPQFAHPDG